MTGWIIVWVGAWANLVVGQPQIMYTSRDQCQVVADKLNAVRDPRESARFCVETIVPQVTIKK